MKNFLETNHFHLSLDLTFLSSFDETCEKKYILTIFQNEQTYHIFLFALFIALWKTAIDIFFGFFFKDDLDNHHNVTLQKVNSISIAIQPHISGYIAELYSQKIASERSSSMLYVDGWDEWIDGWMVIIGHGYSKSPFGAN